ncbi:MAG: protein kinase [Planctomycetota bacterium]
MVQGPGSSEGFVRRPSSSEHARPHQTQRLARDAEQTARDLSDRDLGDQDPGALSGPSASGFLPRAQELRPGDAIGGYRVQGVIGAGSFGRIYLVERPGLGRRFALKLLPDPDPDALARFEREAHLASRLDDPGIVAVFDLGRHGVHPYYVMEYCPGQTLADRLRAGPLEPREAARLLADLARTLSRAHAEGVLHRDLKPANVLLPFGREAPGRQERDASGVAERSSASAPANVLLPEGGGRARITDFGLARALGGGRSLTQTGDFLGTPYYVAPEQARDAKRVDARADVYALGAILYECLTGERPFLGATVLQVLQRLSEDPTPLASARRPDLPPELDRICLWAMQRDPERRCPSAAALAEALEAFLAAPPPAPPAAVPRGLWWALAAGAPVLGAAAGLWAMSPGAPPAPTPARSAASAAPSPQAPSPPQDPPQDPVALLARARAALGRGDPAQVAQALACVDAALSARPGELEAQAELEAHALRGLCAARLDRREESERDLGLALRAAGKDALLQALARAGASEAERGRSLRAALTGLGLRLPLPAAPLQPRVAEWTRDVPEAARGLLGSALLAAARGQPLAELRDDLLGAARLAPGSLAAALWRARVLAGRDAYDLAQAAIDAARGLAVGQPAARAELARLEADLLWRRGNLHDSPPAWRAVHALDPTGPDGATALVEAWFLERREGADRKPWPEMLARVRGARAQAPRHSRARALEVLLLLEQDPLAGVRLADEALEDEGCLDAQLLSFRAFAFSDLARDYPDLVLREWDLVFGVTLGCYHRIGGVGSALTFVSPEVQAWRMRVMREAARLEPERAHVHEYLGAVLLLGGADREEVLGEWRRAHALEPRNRLNPGFLSLFERRFGPTPELQTLRGGK